MGLSLRIWYQFDMMYGVSRNRLNDTELLSVSIQEDVQSVFIVSNFLRLHWIIHFLSSVHCKIVHTVYFQLSLAFLQ